MKWIDYIFECLHVFIAHAHGSGGDLYIKSMGRLENSTDAVVGAISFIIGVILLICAIVLTRHIWIKHHPHTPYKGYYATKSQQHIQSHEENRLTEKYEQTLNETQQPKDNPKN